MRDGDLVFLARRVAVDRLISTVDPEAPHGGTTSSRGFDGYDGYIPLDPTSEIIMIAKVTARFGRHHGHQGDRRQRKGGGAGRETAQRRAFACTRVHRPH